MLRLWHTAERGNTMTKTTITLTPAEIRAAIRLALNLPFEADIVFTTQDGADYNATDVPVQITGARITHA